MYDLLQQACKLKVDATYAHDYINNKMVCFTMIKLVAYCMCHVYFDNPSAYLFTGWSGWS